MLATHINRVLGAAASRGCRAILEKPVLYVARESLERLRDVDVLLGTREKEGYAVLLRQLLALLQQHGPFEGHPNESLRVEKLRMATGYFNLPSRYRSLLIDGALSMFAHLPAPSQHEHDLMPPVEIMTASPQANGFFGAAGIKGALPMAYTLLERAFLDEVRACEDEAASCKARCIHNSHIS